MPFKPGAVLPSKGTWVICGADFCADRPEVRALCNQFVSRLGTGNDAYCLARGTRRNFEVIDCMGARFDAAMGSGWDVAGKAGATKDHTLVRKCGIICGNEGHWQGGDNEFTSEWLVWEKDEFSSLGHMTELYECRIFEPTASPTGTPTKRCPVIQDGKTCEDWIQVNPEYTCDQLMAEGFSCAGCDCHPYIPFDCPMIQAGKNCDQWYEETKDSAQPYTCDFLEAQGHHCGGCWCQRPTPDPTAAPTHKPTKTPCEPIAQGKNCDEWFALNHDYTCENLSQSGYDCYGCECLGYTHLPTQKPTPLTSQQCVPVYHGKNCDQWYESNHLYTCEFLENLGHNCMGCHCTLPPPPTLHPTALKETRKPTAAYLPTTAPSKALPMITRAPTFLERLHVLDEQGHVAKRAWYTASLLPNIRDKPASMRFQQESDALELLPFLVTSEQGEFSLQLEFKPSEKIQQDAMLFGSVAPSSIRSYQLFYSVGQLRLRVRSGQEYIFASPGIKRELIGCRVSERWCWLLLNIRPQLATIYLNHVVEEKIIVDEGLSEEDLVTQLEREEKRGVCAHQPTQPCKDSGQALNCTCLIRSPCLGQETLDPFQCLELEGRTYTVSFGGGAGSASFFDAAPFEGKIRNIVMWRRTLSLEEVLEQKERLQRIGSIGTWVLHQDSILDHEVRVTQTMVLHGNGYTLRGGDSTRHLVLHGESLTIDAVLFRGGHVVDSGGSIQVVTGHLTVTNSIFYANEAKQGGAISFASQTKGSFYNTTFELNKASSSGGALFVGWDVDLTFEDCNFAFNTAGDRGGALAIYNIRYPRGSCPRGTRHRPDISPNCWTRCGCYEETCPYCCTSTCERIVPWVPCVEQPADDCLLCQQGCTHTCSTLHGDCERQAALRVNHTIFRGNQAQIGAAVSLQETNGHFNQTSWIQNQASIDGGGLHTEGASHVSFDLNDFLLNTAQDKMSHVVGPSFLLQRTSYDIVDEIFIRCPLFEEDTFIQECSI